MAEKKDIPVIDTQSRIGFDEMFFEDDEFDPLALEDNDTSQADADEGNPWDAADYPSVRNMPIQPHREPVFSPERQGSVKKALLALLDSNPARRVVLLTIVDMCRNGCVSSAVSEKVNELQEDNYSVYAPMTMCRMLERAGALTLEMPEVSEAHVDLSDGVEYLEIDKTVDPIWRATDAACEVYDELTQGAEFRDIVLDKDSRYLEVYKAVMELALAGPVKRQAIEELVETFEIVKKPRRFGGHFIDMLEKTDAFIWKNRAWNLTDLGRSMLAEMEGSVDD